VMFLSMSLSTMNSVLPRGVSTVGWQPSGIDQPLFHLLGQQADSLMPPDTDRG